MKSYDVPLLRAHLNNGWKFGISPDHTEDGHRYRREDTGELAWSVTTKLGFVAKPYLYRWYVKRAIEYIREHSLELGDNLDGVLGDAGGAAVRSRDTSAEIGTTAHDAFDRYLSRWIREGVRDGRRSAVDDLADLCKSKGVEPRGEEIAACRSFDRFIREVEIIPLASEIRIWYQKGNDLFAGTVDAIFLHLTVYKGREGNGRFCTNNLFVSNYASANDKERVYEKVENEHDYTTQSGGTFWCAACGRETKAELVLGDHKTSNDIKTKDDYAHQSVAYGVSIEKEKEVKFDAIWIMRYGKGKAEYEICKVADRKAAWNEWLTISRAFDAKVVRGDVRLLAPLKETKITSLL